MTTKTRLEPETPAPKNLSATARFTSGSTMRHLVIMTSTSAVGFMAIFLVELLDILFLGLLGQAELVAAVGYAGSIIFFTTSLNFGLAIAAGALTAQALGRGSAAEAKQIATNAIVFSTIVSLVLAVIVWFSIPSLLTLLGASGKTLELGITYLQILAPGTVLLSIGMAGANILRAKGDAKGSMYVTLIGAGVNLILDPIFIFGFGWGISGAAWATLGAHITICSVALWGIAYKHQLLGGFSLKLFIKDISKITKIAVPSTLTNVSEPFGNAYVIACISAFGDSAVAGMAIIGRLIPVAFALTFALSTAVGPVIGQNFGAHLFDRVKQTLVDALKLSTAVALGVSIVMFLLQDVIVLVFNASDDGAELIRFFCTFIAISFIFQGMLFIANTAFNNLGRPVYSTISNFVKAIVLTVPFAYLGAEWGGYKGVLVGQALASVMVSIVTYWVCMTLVKKISLNYPSA